MKSQQQQVRYIEVSSEHTGRRLDNFLAPLLKGVPSSLIYRLLRQGEIRVNKKRCKPSYRLQAQDMIRIAPIRQSVPRALAQPSQSLVTHLKQAVLFENSKLMIIDKPSGLPVHGGTGVSYGLIEALRTMHPAHSFLELAHRLDRETSGCLIIAKKPSVLRQINQLFQQNKVQKLYQALTLGHWQQQKTMVQASLKKQCLESGERLVKVCDNGKSAQTIFRCSQSFDGAELMNVQLLTGRTHQIRVHSQYAGHPIAGDSKYGDKAFNRMMQKKGLKRLFLHAKQLKFELEGQTIAVQAPLAEELQHCLQQLHRS